MVQVSDGALADTVTVTVTVNAVDDAPVITQGTSLSTKTRNEDTTFTWTAAELNATDADTSSGSLTWSVDTNATNGVATVSGTGSSPATFSYVPDGNYSGGDSFVVQVSDGALADTVTVTVTVNAVDDAPVITQGTSLSTKTGDEDTTFSWTAAELNATDADTSAGSLTWSVDTNATNGVATVSGTGSNPTTFTYVPDGNYSGGDSFVVQVSDGALTDTVTVTVTVSAVDDAPVITQGTSLSTKTGDEDTTFSWTAAELNATDADTSAGSLTWSVDTNATDGVATVSGTGSNPTTFTYLPDSNYSGSDSFVVQVSDGALADTVTVTVTVNAVNDAPAITQGTSLSTKTGNEDTTFTWTAAELNATDADTSSGSLTWERRY